jgi:hypothetical protein
MAAGGRIHCSDIAVTVDGKPARSVLAEFEIAAGPPLAEVFTAVDPEHWPNYGGDVVKAIKPIGPTKDQAWADIPAGKSPPRRTYLEEATLGVEQLTNVLVFDVLRTDRWFAFTFDLAHSLDGRVEVDRGYFLVTDQGGRRRVKARKIIRLADGPGSALSRLLIDQACPLWGEWIKEILAEAPLEGGPGAPGSTEGVDPADALKLLAAAYRHRLLDCANRSTRAYGDYAAEVGSELMSGSYSTASAVRDGLRLSWQLTQELARVGGYALQVVEAIEAETRPHATRPGLMSLHPVEHVIWPLPGSGPIEAQDLRSISPEGTVLPKTRIVVTRTTHDGGPAARVAIDTTHLPYGMYIGNLMEGGAPVPFQFYVSQAVPSAS